MYKGKLFATNKLVDGDEVFITYLTMDEARILLGPDADLEGFPLMEVHVAGGKVLLARPCTTEVAEKRFSESLS